MTQNQLVFIALAFLGVAMSFYIVYRSKKGTTSHTLGKGVTALFIGIFVASIISVPLIQTNQVVAVQKFDGNYKIAESYAKFLKKTSTRKDCARIELGTFTPDGESKKVWENNCEYLKKLNLPDLTQEEKVAYETEMLEGQIANCEENESGKDELYNNKDEEYKKESEAQCTEFRKQYETVQATGVTEW